MGGKEELIRGNGGDQDRLRHQTGTAAKVEGTSQYSAGG